VHTKLAQKAQPVLPYRPRAVHLVKVQVAERLRKNTKSRELIHSLPQFQCLITANAM
jgi:hypothetical protein